MQENYTNQQLEELVVGKKKKPYATFYDQSRLDPAESHKQGKRVYVTKLMILRKAEGLADCVPAFAQPKDIADYPNEYQLYLNTKNDPGSPSITTIPGIDPNHIQELVDRGIATISKLCETPNISPHLQYVQDSAIRINEVFKNEQSSNRKTEAKKESTSKAEVVLTADRPVNPGHEQRPTVSRSEGISGGEIEEGLREGGRINSYKGMTSNWAISVNQ